MKTTLYALFFLICLCANPRFPRPADQPPPWVAPRITPLDNHGDPSRPVGVYIRMEGGPPSGREWGGDERSIVYGIREARRMERRHRGLSGRDRYLLRNYPTPEAYARIAPTVYYTEPY